MADTAITYDKPIHIYTCDNTVDGIFTAVYNAFSSRYGHDFNRIVIRNYNNNFELFSEYIDVISDSDKSLKLASSIKSKIGTFAYEMIIRATMTECQDKGNCIYHFLILGFYMGSQVTDCLQNHYVCRVFEMSRRVGFEYNHLLGFIRFSELYNGILCSIISPDNNILELFADHFDDRLGIEDWIICDERREIGLIHKKGTHSFLIKLSSNDVRQLKNSSNEENIESLWKLFFNTIAIQDRANYKLQRQMLPIRFRSNMLEFNKGV